jgi:hypothetical protein
MGNYRPDCRKAVAGSISVNRDRRIGRYLRLESIADRRRSAPSFGIDVLGVKKAVGLVNLLLEIAKFQSRGCGPFCHVRAAGAH